MITRLKKNSFNNYYKNKFKVLFKDRKKAWETINEITNYKYRRKTEIKYLKNENGEQLRKSQEKSNCLNQYFNKIGHEMAQKFDDSEQNYCDNIKTPESTIFMSNTDVSEVQKIVKGLKINKAPGIDGISNYIIKVSENIITPHLVNLFNSCMTTGVFPDDLKIACITPLYKDGDPSDPSNYRPISLLPQFGKMFERIIKKRFVNFFDKHQLITEHQFGFRENYCTELAVAEIQDMLLKNLDDNRVSCTIFLDLKKAFDSVDHGILLKKLEKHGIRGNALSLIKSYLTNRKHAVKLENCLSDFLTLKIGVPQGSVLGPLLFLIFINDLPNCSNFATKLFADDTLLSAEAKNFEDLQAIVNCEIDKVCKWLSQNKLTLNVKKSKFMIVANQTGKKRENFFVSMNGNNLERCQSYKYLGVFLDENLCWNTHIDYICEKVSKVCGIFAKLRYCVDFDLLKTVYHALVESHLLYCNLSWGDARKNILKPLQILQNRIIRIMTFAPFSCSNVSQLFEDVEILKLDQIHLLSKAKFMHKHKNKKLPTNFEHYFSKTNQCSRYNLRSASNSDYKCTWGKTSKSTERLQYKAVKIWNTIPKEIRNLSSLANFCAVYKVHLLNETIAVC